MTLRIRGRVWLLVCMFACHSVFMCVHRSTFLLRVTVQVRVYECQNYSAPAFLNQGMNSWLTLYRQLGDILIKEIWKLVKSCLCSVLKVNWISLTMTAKVSEPWIENKEYKNIKVLSLSIVVFANNLGIVNWLPSTPKGDSFELNKNKTNKRPYHDVIDTTSFQNGK